MDVFPLYSNTPCGVEAELVPLPHARSVMIIPPLANGIIISHEYDRLIQVSRINSESFSWCKPR